ncbi:hypothetical protein AO263_32900 [Pseudomonas sp. NZIPFR-PS5]|nr:hypothetical protein AO263_32900 [Pseudomonas sp. NZIPFR-PS5]
MNERQRPPFDAEQTDWAGILRCCNEITRKDLIKPVAGLNDRTQKPRGQPRRTDLESQGGLAKGD